MAVLLADGPASATSTRLAATGYTLKVGVEAEHMLITRAADGSIAPFDPTGSDTLDKPCYDFKGLAANLDYLRDLIRYMEGLGWEPYASDHEDGTAQFELNWKYADALTTADRYTFFKMMTSQIAREVRRDRDPHAQAVLAS